MSRQPCITGLLEPVVHPITPKPSLVEQLAQFFKARPLQWIDGKDLEFAGRYAWRSRVSQCRTDMGMNIKNRLRHVTTDNGRFTISEYCYCPVANDQPQA